MCVQKVAGASPDRWRQCVKEDPPRSMGQCLVFLCHPPVTRRPSTMSPWQTSCPASAAEPLLDRGACRLQASGDSTGGRAWSRMTTTTVRARRVGRPSSSAEWCTVSPQCLPGRHRVPRLQQSRFWTVEPVAYRRQATARVDVRGAG